MLDFWWLLVYHREVALGEPASAFARQYPLPLTGVQPMMNYK
jgi:hypothetical protein